MFPAALSVCAITAGLSACTVSTQDNFTNPPAGPPATCTVTAAIDGCEGGSVSYACTSDRPDHGDTNLVCSAGTPAAAGTQYCCAPYGQYFSECTVSTSIPGCVGNSFGFACTGATSPDQADTSLTCSTGLASGGATSYCCSSGAVTPTCAFNASVQGECTGAAIGYACIGADRPAASNPSVACGPVSPPAGVTGSAYCCLPFAKSASGCDEDDAVAGCGNGSFGFSCAGSATPSETNPALHCGAGASGVTTGTDASVAPGATQYCCQL